MRRSSLILVLFLSGLCHLFFFTAFKPVLSSQYPITFLSYRGKVELIPRVRGTIPNGINKDEFIFSGVKPYFSLNIFRKEEPMKENIPGEYRNSLVEFPANRVLSFKIPVNGSSFESFLSLKNTGEMFQKHVFFKSPVSFDVFISPAGRAISVKDPQRHISSTLRSALVLKLKKNIFPSKGSYYWKNIEIVLK